MQILKSQESFDNESGAYKLKLGKAEQTSERLKKENAQLNNTLKEMTRQIIE